jgi:hypothetical protein
VRRVKDTLLLLGWLVPAVVVALLLWAVSVGAPSCECPVPPVTPTRDCMASVEPAAQTRAYEIRADAIATQNATWWGHATSVWEESDD